MPKRLRAGRQASSIELREYYTGLLLPDPRFREDKFLEDKFRRNDTPTRLRHYRVLLFVMAHGLYYDGEFGMYHCAQRR
jgi:hypothetical protein